MQQDGTWTGCLEEKWIDKLGGGWYNTVRCFDMRTIFCDGKSICLLKGGQAMRTFLSICCVVLIFSNWSGASESETEYYAVFMEGAKIGYSINTRSVEDRRVTTTDETTMTMGRGAAAVTVQMVETSIETMSGEPVGFKLVQNLGMMRTQVSGKVSRDGKVNVTTTSMGSEQKSTFDWPEGALMAEGLRLLEVKKGLKEGLTYRAKVFSPATMQAMDAQVRVGPKQNVDLLGRVVPLTEVETTLFLPGAGEMLTRSYVDDNLRIQKSITPAMGMQIEVIACDKKFALSDSDVVDFFGRFLLKSPARLSSSDLGHGKTITYYLAPNADAALRIPSSDNQTVHWMQDGKIAVSVEPVRAAGASAFPYTGSEPEALEAMKATQYIQSDAPEIAELSRRAVAGAKDAAEAVKQIESFVSGHINQKDLSVGYASALEVASSKQGDCSEHAVLAAALCRAAGIPARVASGLVYSEGFLGQEDIFGPHAWTEAYVGGKWVGLDAARSPQGFGPGHIMLAMGNGDPADFFGMVSTLGQFKIEKVEVED
ncbi:MAG: transglutaminase domain-containing protein [Planctomycetota bacterium]|nr:MAG: transglutaminase domain-containing protein [Planctomycetota bacterium]